MSNICDACPCAFTEKSEQVYNLGCLPTPHELIEIAKNGKNWCCHEDENKACVGFAIFCKENDIEYNKDLPLASYRGWYYDGEP